MRCVILQPSYIPWRGYFDLIHRADLFVFYDDVQYDARGWRNRNRIKTPHGSRWLTIPVHKHGAQADHTPINAVEVAGDEWAARHLASLEHSYSNAPYYSEHAAWLREVYASPPRNLADFTIRVTEDLSRLLGITSTRFLRSSSLNVSGRKTERLIAVLREVGATSYLSGPSARDYIDAGAFEEAGIDLEWITYEYPEYGQLYPPYDPHVTVLDTIFMAGPDAGALIWG